MSAYWGTEDEVTAAISASTAGGSAVFAPGKPADVKRVILAVAVTNTVAATGTVAIRNIDDSSSVTVGTFTVPINSPVNTVYAIEIATSKATVQLPGTSQVSDVTTGKVDGYFTSEPGVAEVNVGKEIVVSFAGGTGGTVNVHFEYVEQGNNPLRFNPTKLAFTLA
jgi:hypothetical protein